MELVRCVNSGRVGEGGRTDGRVKRGRYGRKDGRVCGWTN
jgi:hypothetical protein